MQKTTDNDVKRIKARLDQLSEQNVVHEIWDAQDAIRLILLLVAVILVGFVLATLLTGCSRLPYGLIPVTATSAPTLAPEIIVSVPSETPEKQLADVASKPRPTATTARAWCTVAGGHVNVRSGPGMTYPVIDVAAEDEQLLLIGDAADGWQRVCTPRLVEGYFYTVRWCK